MSMFVQDALATALAIGALALIVRRVLGVLFPPPSQPPGCATCPSCAPAAVRPELREDAGAAPRPMVLIRSRKSV